MTYKTVCRITGSWNVGAWAFIGFLCYRILWNIDFHFFVEDYSILYKLYGAMFVTIFIIIVPIYVTGIMDGLIDIVKGTHHYLGLKIWQELVKNEKTKAEIETEIEKQMQY